MDFEKFSQLSKDYNIIPISKTITADLLTPVLAYLRIRDENSFCFLLESVEGIGNLARYSFIGKNPFKTIYNYANELVIENGEKTKAQKNIFDYLQEDIKNYKVAPVEGIPNFSGGLVGYIGFENISLVENVIQFDKEKEIDIPDSILGYFEIILAFDHYKHQINIICNTQINNENNLEEIYNSALKKISGVIDEIKSPSKLDKEFTIEKFSDNPDKKEFHSEIEAAKNNIFEGDVFQLVLSRRFHASYTGDLINVYRALRIINPSPHMYFMEFGDGFSIIGTSPEDLVTVYNRRATILPIAGTRRRGKTDEEDLELEKELLNDPKELAEHVMLVDLARNDLGRVAEVDTVKVIKDKIISRFSHVMHIVSEVEGELQGDKDSIDAFKVAFPAGTLTGAPKIRAIQLINDYEKVRRSFYGGAVGYIDFKGNLDMCIAIRSMFAKDNKVYWQAGAGIVADSKPELELKEIHNKSAVLVSALKYAEKINENIAD
ncbi:MAG: chorismate-binding protein [Ignavibacteria bacterium]|jgi:anthranilate synthase component 1